MNMDELDRNNQVLHAMVEGLHSMVFGVMSIDSGDYALSSLKDGGSIHEYVHAMLRLLPPRCPPLESDGIGKLNVSVETFNAQITEREMKNDSQS